jgi:hypothetical protein
MPLPLGIPASFLDSCFDRRFVNPLDMEKDSQMLLGRSLDDVMGSLSRNWTCLLFGLCDALTVLYIQYVLVGSSFGDAMRCCTPSFLACSLLGDLYP